MASDRRRLYVLGGVLAALVGVYVWTGQSDPTPASTRGVARAVPINPTTAAPGDVPTVKLEALKSKPAELGVEARNPFRVQPKPPPPTEETATPRRPPKVEVPLDQLPVVQAPPPPPPIPLKFIGIVSTASAGGRLAVLSDGRFVYFGREGDIIDGRFRIVRVGEESIELEHADGRGKQTIRLSGS